jgi:hypothetical protein
MIRLPCGHRIPEENAPIGRAVFIYNCGCQANIRKGPGGVDVRGYPNEPDG